MASATDSSSGASDGAEKASKHHYVFGSGMVGCLYDYGPEFCESIEDAIASLDNVFGDSISEEESESMARNLREQGIHFFADRCQAGADYCEVSKQPGACPVWDDRTGRYIDPETSEDE